MNQHIRGLPGGAQSHLMRSFDGGFYVVKFKNNPQGPRILANEWLCTSLARRIGLPAPEPAIVHVEELLIRATAALRIDLGGKRVPCESGLAFGSRYVVHPMDGQVFDYMPDELLNDTHIRNLGVFAGALAFDKWVSNADGRQVVYWRRSRERKYAVCLIDQGDCFNDDNWSFPDAPLRGVFPQKLVYRQVTGWESFQPWLAQIERFPEYELRQLAKRVPEEWYADDREALDSLLAALLKRRDFVRRLIEEFRDARPDFFPAWK